jgi:cytochrome c-type biogenesis protein
VADPSTLGLLVAFAAGAVSFLSPCVLPLVPAYVSYVAGETVRGEGGTGLGSRLAALATSVPFVAGFSAVFIAFGASATAIGQLLQRYRYEANLAAAAFVIAMGLFMLGLARWIPWLHRDLRVQLRLGTGGVVPSFALGAAFAFGWTPCIGPILAAILALTASGTANGAVALLAAYSLGLGVPFLASALFVDRGARVLARLRRTGAVLRTGSGVVLVAMGLAMATGELTVFSRWLLDAFPALGSIG